MPFDPSILTPEQPDPMKDDRVCTECGYSLKGLARGGACPECGIPERAHEPAILAGGPAEPAQVIQQCGKCGYPLKGLPSIGNCPECGSSYRPSSSRRRYTDLIEPMTLVSTSFRIGLMLLITAIVSALFMQVIVLFYRIEPGDYKLVMTMSSIVWALGLCLVVVRRVAGKHMFLRFVWLITLASQWLWPLAYALSRYGSINQNAVGSLHAFGIIIFDVAAAIGLFSSLCFLAMICRDLYLRRQASRLELVALIFPFYAMGIWIFSYPAEVQDGIFHVGGGFRLIIYLIVLGPWWILFIMVGLAIKDVFIRSLWEGRLEESNTGRVSETHESPARSTDPKDGSRPDSGDIPLSSSDAEAAD
ncbi:MAG: hypothetical protein P8J89_02100 [Phycisphaerales bacterium]|nr:hypothetical protein [Phycisphaerales bacterium]